MAVATLTLAEFLLARVAEDEAKARQAAQVVADWAQWRKEDGREATPGELTLSVVDFTDQYIIDYDPARVLAECEAKRRIVSQFDDVDYYLPGDVEAGYESAHAVTLRLLALPYADHPDYRDEFRP